MANFRVFESEGKYHSFVNVDAVSFIKVVNGGCELHFIGDAETLFIPQSASLVEKALKNPHNLA